MQAAVEPARVIADRFGYCIAVQGNVGPIPAGELADQRRVAAWTRTGEGMFQFRRPLPLKAIIYQRLYGSYLQGIDFSFRLT